MRVAKLKGRWVVITGAGAGIGRAIALDTARRGGNVAICDIDAARLKETRALLADYGVDVIASPRGCHQTRSGKKVCGAGT